MALQSRADFRVPVAAEIVEDHVNDFSGRDLTLNLIEKADEFLLPVTLRVLVDHRSALSVERCKEYG